MNHLLDIAAALNMAYSQKANMQNEIDANEHIKERRELALVPEGGWSTVGKNEGDRVTAKQLTFVKDIEWLLAQTAILTWQHDLRTLQGTVEGLLAEQRAIEMSIRDETNRVLGGRSMLDMLQDEAVEQGLTQFDEAMQHNLANGDEPAAAIEKAADEILGEGHNITPVTLEPPQATPISQPAFTVFESEQPSFDESQPGASDNTDFDQ